MASVNGFVLLLLDSWVESALSHHAFGIRMSFLSRDTGSTVLEAAETWRIAVALEVRDGVSAG